jgi:tetratricopeptide (TPR) repeat protein
MSVLRRLTGRTLAERYLERGLWHLDKKKYDDALADLVEAIHQEPYNAELYATRGFIYLEADDDEYVEFAREDFDYALYIDPEQWVAHYCLGMLDYADKDYHEALRRFTLARDYAHLHPEPYYYRALCYYQLDEPERAIIEMNTAIQIFEEQHDSRRSSAKRWRTHFTKAVRDRKRDQRQLGSGAPSPILRDQQRPSLVERTSDSPEEPDSDY